MIHALPPAIVAGELVRLQTRQHVVALTFDGGGNADGAKAVLAVLRQERVTGTFFLSGHFLKAYPTLARAIGRRYPVGNHTINHLDLRRLSTRSAEGEITGAESLIKAATGRDPQPYFRFPYGARDGRTLSIVHRLGYASVRWTVDTWGWMGAPSQSVAGAAHRVTDHLVPGEIVMMHLGSSRDRRTIDADALPRVIRAVRARGYRFVTLKGVRAPSAP
ncbi:MAG: polysaccharide deacetylase family protein [Actinomycetota bacterium]|nr:polysaccharide deacetylase family protein [Actinomycetota bacterium]